MPVAFSSCHHGRGEIIVGAAFGNCTSHLGPWVAAHARGLVDSSPHFPLRTTGGGGTQRTLWVSPRLLFRKDPMGLLCHQQAACLECLAYIGQMSVICGFSCTWKANNLAPRCPLDDKCKFLINARVTDPLRVEWKLNGLSHWLAACEHLHLESWLNLTLTSWRKMSTVDNKISLKQPLVSGGAVSFKWGLKWYQKFKDMRSKR